MGPPGPPKRTKSIGPPQKCPKVHFCDFGLPEPVKTPYTCEKVRLGISGAPKCSKVHFERLERFGPPKVVRSTTDSKILKKLIFVKNKITKKSQKSSKIQKCHNAYDLPDFCPADASKIVKITKSALWSTFALLKSKVLKTLYI